MIANNMALEKLLCLIIKELMYYRVAPKESQ